MLHRLWGLATYPGEKLKSEDIIERQIGELVEAINDGGFYLSYIAGYWNERWFNTAKCTLRYTLAC